MWGPRVTLVSPTLCSFPFSWASWTRNTDVETRKHVFIYQKGRPHQGAGFGGSRWSDPWCKEGLPAVSLALWLVGTVRWLHGQSAMKNRVRESRHLRQAIRKKMVEFSLGGGEEQRQVTLSWPPILPCPATLTYLSLSVPLCGCVMVYM